MGNGSNNKPTTIYSEGGQSILTAMHKVGIKKLITITSGGVQKDDPVIQKSFFYKYFGLWYLRHIYADMEKWEQILEQNKDLDRVCVRPTYLRNGKLTKKYRVNTTYSPEKGWKISRADLAEFITKQVDSDKFIHQKPTTIKPYFKESDLVVPMIEKFLNKTEKINNELPIVLSFL